MDLPSGMFLTTESCLEFSLHRRFEDYKVDSECFEAGKKALVERYVKQVLKKK